MQIWRLVAHHEQGLAAVDAMKSQGRIAIGWNDIGDLREIAAKDSRAITEAIKGAYPTLKNAHLGGPSLWAFYRSMCPGDLVIISSLSARRCVFRVTGDYFFDEEDQLCEYSHQRAAELTDLSAEQLWHEVGARYADGYNQRWTLVLCGAEETPQEESPTYQEGSRHSVTATAIERNPAARAACLTHYGYDCQACGFNFASTYGEHGKHYIHVHHRVELASSDGPVYTNPEKDLVPLCPNCHAMVHRGKETMSIEALRQLLDENKAS